MTAICVRLGSALMVALVTAPIAAAQDLRSEWIDPARTRVIDQPQAGAANEEEDDFGRTLAVGDFDGDGRLEVAIGAPGDEAGGVSTGRVYVVPEPGATAVAVAALAALAGVGLRRTPD